MPKDATPRKPQAFQPEDRAQGGSHSQPDAQLPMKSDAAAENPEQVFAGECGDPIWEGRRPAEARPPHRVPRTVPEERLPAGRIIELGQQAPASRAAGA